MNTERLIKHAVQENLSITVCINKVDQFSIHRLVDAICVHEKLSKLFYITLKVYQLRMCYLEMLLTSKQSLLHPVKQTSLKREVCVCYLAPNNKISQF